MIEQMKEDLDQEMKKFQLKLLFVEDAYKLQTTFDNFQREFDNFTKMADNMVKELEGLG